MSPGLSRSSIPSIHHRLEGSGEVVQSNDDTCPAFTADVEQPDCMFTDKIHSGNDDQLNDSRSQYLAVTKTASLDLEDGVSRS
jgi:hypothetical protein